MRTSIRILDDGAYEVSAYRTDGTGYGLFSRRVAAPIVLLNAAGVA